MRFSHGWVQNGPPVPVTARLDRFVTQKIDRSGYRDRKKMKTLKVFRIPVLETVPWTRHFKISEQSL